MTDKKDFLENDGVIPFERQTKEPVIGDKVKFIMKGTAIAKESTIEGKDYVLVNLFDQGLHMWIESKDVEVLE